MGVKVTFKTRFKVNGKEYGSLEELPADIRAAYEKALAAKGGLPAAATAAGSAKITFNGSEYASADEMPPDERRMYESVMAAVESHAATPEGVPLSADAVDPGRPIVPGGSGLSAKWIWIAAGLIVLLAALVVLARAAAR